VIEIDSLHLASQSEKGRKEGKREGESGGGREDGQVEKRVNVSRN
jgi:hypothetical protein